MPMLRAGRRPGGRRDIDKIEKNIMEKTVLFFAAAAMLAGCAKNEVVTTPEGGAKEITFETSPVVKTPTSTQKDFTNTNVFASAAYYIDETDANGDIIKFADWDWNSKTEPDLFIGTENANTGAIDGDVIAWNTTDKVWRSTSRKYYWPKKGQLTFFAWSLNKANLDFPKDAKGNSTWVSCTAAQGVVAMNYDIELNKNVDFMVADIAADKTANENVYYHAGVPTLFRQKLSQLYLTVKEKDKYQDQDIYLTLKSITFNKLNKDANYTQTPDKMTVGSTTTDQSYTSADQKVDQTTATEIESVDQYIYLPQSFDDNKTIEVTYTIGYDLDGDGTVDKTKGDIVETITETKKLSEIFGTEWTMGKKYTLDITFALDEILWDPAVQDWISTDAESKDVDVK